jgi:hypothetical protein
VSRERGEERLECLLAVTCEGHLEGGSRTFLYPRRSLIDGYPPIREGKMMRSVNSRDYSVSTRVDMRAAFCSD